jgi:hypothetical protein
MNRLILRYGGQIATVILAVFAWVIYRRIADGGVAAIVLLGVTALVVWVLGTFLFIYFWPRITVTGFKRAILRYGLGDGPIPVNTLYAVRQSPSQSAASGTLIATGADDLLYVCGWLDLTDGARVLHVPEMHDRYYSIQLTDPASGANFAYVGKRTTGTAARSFLLCERTWRGQVPAGMDRIDLPHRTALLVGRVFVADEADRSAAYELASQIDLSRQAVRG